MSGSELPQARPFIRSATSSQRPSESGAVLSFLWSVKMSVLESVPHELMIVVQVLVLIHAVAFAFWFFLFLRDLKKQRKVSPGGEEKKVRQGVAAGVEPAAHASSAAFAKPPGTEKRAV
ncbi:unnamed protein product [Vitrella brassicaformis CCMP3155]|uniref:Uncharacterized protein n=2 Tax=Vitrella brassicaformis TaxID=1169539 RepID=A0A0G4G6M8_VITBC|nr:unnamed protein product [Vitrella brassicaformis CCMP3155]|mmetsp:Transcript_41085/g.102624  ORF Transcript_41085/g.102624 Transcript_41085/m.102624 type:complete len:119 (+) Transcript_41085:99-455(+)|eukprot:CEM24126.1 unnamed protein product [Vitrella brassicaformis CCMP3155]